MLAWMAYALVCSACVTLVGLGADTIVRHRRGEQRVVWAVAMLMSVLSAVVLPVVLPLAHGFLHTFVAREAPTTPVPLHGVQAAFAADAVLHSSSLTVSLTPLLIAGWIALSLAALVVLVASHVRLRQQLRGFRATRLGDHALLISRDFGPALVGWLRPIVVLPEWTLRLGAAERELVVSHEFEHRRARDPLLLLLGLALAVLFPWNAVLWWQLARLRLAMEFDCDARVIARCGADPVSYGRVLVTAHEHVRRVRAVVLALTPMRSVLGQRVRALLERRPLSHARRAGALSIATSALGAVLVLPSPSLPFSLRTFERAADAAALRTPQIADRAPAVRSSIVRRNADVSAPPVRVPARVREPIAAARIADVTRATVHPTMQSSDAPTIAPHGTDSRDVSVMRTMSGGAVTRAAVRTPGDGMYGAVVRAARSDSGRDAAAVRAYRGGFMDAEVRPDSTHPATVPPR